MRDTEKIGKPVTGTEIYFGFVGELSHRDAGKGRGQVTGTRTILKIEKRKRVVMDRDRLMERWMCCKTIERW